MLVQVTAQCAMKEAEGTPHQQLEAQEFKEEDHHQGHHCLPSALTATLQ